MKLCRFELRTDPGTVRSGVYHDGRFYETDGENAIGIHDPGSVHLLAPVASCPAIRVFERARLEDGQWGLTYSFSHPGRLQATATEIDASGVLGELDLDVHVAALLQGSNESDPTDPGTMVLGYSIFVRLFDATEREQFAALGASTQPATDMGSLYGPFIVTPDDLVEARAGSDPTRMTWNASILVNDELVASGSYDPILPLRDLIEFAARKGPIGSGEILAWPAWDKPAMEATQLGRPLQAADKVAVTVEPLGMVVGRII
ncbi:MAG: hypothetical protein JSS66_01805 [Armatimonadetes bacterium]|nr:hypothetical protein [Armatimonadota bacterium]